MPRATDAVLTLAGIGLPRCRQLLDAVDIGILVCSVDASAILDANIHLCDMFGYTRQAVLALHPDRLLALGPLLEAAGHAADTTPPMERSCVASDGRAFFCEVSVSHATSCGEPVVVVTACDITERKRLIQALRHSQERLAVATRSARIGIWDWDITRDHLVWDAGMYQLYGIRGEDFGGAYEAWQRGLHPDDRARGDAAIKAAIQGIEDFNIEFRVVWPNGEVHDIEAHALVQGEPGGRATRMIGVNWDITERKRATETIRLQADQYATVISTTPDAFFTFDRMGVICSHNQAFCRMTWYSHEESVGLSIGQLNAAETVAEADLHLAMIAQAGCGRFQAKLRRKDGVLLDIEISVSFWDNTPERYLCFARDITDRLRAQHQIAHMASYDMLTELANRRSFVAMLDQTITRARRSGRSFAVLYLDLDNFKDVNDTLGHPAGDELLKTVAQRLRENVRAGDTVARFGGDEFAIILDDIGEPDDAATVSQRLLRALAAQDTAREDAAAIAAGVADKIVRAMTEPVMINANRVFSGASVGVVVYGHDAPDAETILSNADLALYKAKSERRGSYRFFTSEMDAQFRARVSLGTQLRDALSGGQFCLDYQPQVDIETRRIVGLEALLRWDHPQEGKIGPSTFIDEAERNGLIVPIGRWVIEAACRQSRQWLDAGLSPPLIAVNLSGVQFKLPLELERDITSIVARSGLAPRFMELELTESVLMEASRGHNDVLLRLRQQGFRLAIDDFGSGYSSLDYLRRYPVDRIKIAQTFVAEIGVQPGSDAIVRAALSLARELDIEVVVEGVETAAQVAMLREWGGHIVQGYYFAKPLPAGDIALLLRTGRIAPRAAGRLEVAAP